MLKSWRRYNIIVLANIFIFLNIFPTFPSITPAPLLFPYTPIINYSVPESTLILHVKKKKWKMKKKKQKPHIKALSRKCSVKKVFLEILQKSQENTCAGAWFW